MNSKYEILAKGKGYFVDKYGNAFSPSGRKIGTRGKDPYMYFGIRLDLKKVVKVYIHRLQAYQKYGNAIYGEGVQVRHLNGNSFDNSFDNIDIGSATNNAMDKPKETRLRAALKASSKVRIYSDEDVLEIQRLRKLGLTYKDIMRRFNVKNKSTLRYVLKRNISRNGADG